MDQGRVVAAPDVIRSGRGPRRRAGRARGRRAFFSSRGVAQGGRREAFDCAQHALGELVEGGERVVGEEVALASAPRRRKRTYSAVSSTVADASKKRWKRWWMRGKSDRCARRDTFCSSSGRPTITRDRSAFESHSSWSRIWRCASLSGGSRCASSRNKTGCSLSRLILHVGLDGEEQIRGGRGRMQPERVTEIAVEVIVAVRQPKPSVREAWTKRAQDARFADAGLTEQEHALPLGQRLLDVRDERRLAFGQPERAVVFARCGASARRRPARRSRRWG